MSKRAKREHRVSNLFLSVVVIVSLALSVFFSLQSFTGYVVSEEILSSKNLTALTFFLIGVIGAYFLLRKR